MYLRIRFATPDLEKDISETNPPCKIAELRTHVVIERFPLTGNAETDAIMRKTWKSGGASHREQDSILYRDITVKSWFIKWMTTGPIRELVDRFGGAYLRRSLENNELWELIVGPEVKFTGKGPSVS